MTENAYRALREHLEFGLNNLDMDLLRIQFEQLWDHQSKPVDIEAAVGIEKVTRNRALKSLGARFGNYKTGLSKAVNIGVHYNYSCLGKTDYRVKMWERISRMKTCEGNKSSPGGCQVRIDGSLDWSAAFKRLDLDHTYEQANIIESLKYALGHAVKAGRDVATASGAIKGVKWNIGYLKKSSGGELRYYENEGRTPIQRSIAKVVEMYVNVDKLLEDMYGDGIALRCPNCHRQATKEAGDHTTLDKERYVKTPASDQVQGTPVDASTEQEIETSHQQSGAKKTSAVRSTQGKKSAKPVPEPPTSQLQSNNLQATTQAERQPMAHQPLLNLATATKAAALKPARTVKPATKDQLPGQGKVKTSAGVIKKGRGTK